MIAENGLHRSKLIRGDGNIHAGKYYLTAPAPPTIGIKTRIIATIKAIKRTTQNARPMATPKLGPIVRHRRLIRMIIKMTAFICISAG
jgi:hypothetical protein